MIDALLTLVGVDAVAVDVAAGALDENNPSVSIVKYYVFSNRSIVARTMHHDTCRASHGADNKQTITNAPRIAHVKLKEKIRRNKRYLVLRNSPPPLLNHSQPSLFPTRAVRHPR